MTMHDNVAVEEMLRDAEAAVEPGDLATGQVISRSEDMTMTTSELQSAGWVYVYDTLTADRSVVNRNMLPQQLEKRRSDGSYVFSTRKPEGIESIVGVLNCFLHADDPDREKYDRMGLVKCIKTGFLNELDRSSHMRHRHPRAFATLENERVREEREAEKLERRALTESIIAMAESNRGMKDA
jgi:hypothetical protein